jgi:hypothetical protein
MNTFDRIVDYWNKIGRVERRPYELEEFKELVYDNYLPLLRVTMARVLVGDYSAEFKTVLAGFINYILEIKNVSIYDIPDATVLDKLLKEGRTPDKFLEIMHDYFEVSK